MSKRLGFFSLLAALCAAPLLFAAPAKKNAPAAATYKGAIVINAADGSVLFEDNADIVNPPASVTKLMTFLLVHDAIAAGRITLGTPVGVTHAEAKFAMKRDSTSVWLNERETHTVEELLYAIMIRSANDAALVLSRAVAGSSEAFVGQMNVRARELGMAHTRFATPHGLNPSTLPAEQGDLTTPRDLAILSRELIARTDILKYTSVRTRPFGEGQRNKPVMMTNHNHLLGKVPGVDGLKTGYTQNAGFCLAATAQRDGRRVIAVTMGTPNRIARDAKIAGLIEAAFAKLAETPASPVSPVSPVAPAAPPPAPAAQPAPAQPAPVAPAQTQQTPEIPQVVFPAPGGASGPRK